MNAHSSIASGSAWTTFRRTPAISRDGMWYQAGYLPAELRNKLWARTLRRVAAYFCWMSLWVALPVAVFTCNGFLGLVVHGLALSVTALPFKKRACAMTSHVSDVEFAEGKAPCAPVTSETI